MKNATKSALHDEFHHPARSTVYEVEMYIETGDGIELYDTFKTDSPPELPSEGEFIQVEWIEDDDENEVTDAVPRDEICTDGAYTVLTSPDLEITNIRTTYSKRTLTTDDGDVKHLATVHKTLTLTAP